jgi:hypothetical protein
VSVVALAPALGPLDGASLERAASAYHRVTRRLTGGVPFV